ncbi:MAG: hypothetical protein E6R04_06605 [Spirochaetes bacterium]|nr:MAG: hypothetical protein E6R04_06605 [Spirochaetota bacterium]
MCRPGGRRCPSSRGRSARGTRPSRDVYTTKARALLDDPAVVKGVSKKIPSSLVAFTPQPERADMKRAIASALLEAVANDPLSTVDVTGTDGKTTAAVPLGEVRDAYEKWRLESGNTDATPYTKLELEDISALSAAAAVAANSVRAATTEKERSKACRAAQRDYATADIRSMKISEGITDDVTSAVVDELTYGSGNSHLSDEQVADALAAMNRSVHQNDELATRHWLRQRGIDPERVHLLLSPDREMVVTPSGDDREDVALMERLEREWGVDDGVPNGRELSNRLQQLHDAARDRGITAEFDRAVADKGRVTDLGWTMPGGVSDARARAKAASKEPRSNVHARGPVVGGGDYAKAKHLLGPDATFDELSDEAARLESVPRRFRDEHSSVAIGNRSARDILIEAGIHPSHMVSDSLPTEAKKRVKDVIARRIVALGEDFYTGDYEFFLDNKTKAMSLQKRADYVVEDLFADDPSGYRTLVFNEIHSLAWNVAVQNGHRREREKNAPLNPEDTMDPLF